MRVKSMALRANTAEVIKVDFRKRKPPRARNNLPLAERIERLTDQSAGRFACWGWLGSFSQGHGYAQISYACPHSGKYVTEPVHRALMQIKLGRKLDRDEHVLHARGCTKECVNPAHHRVGTCKENVADAIAEGRTKRPRLKPAQVLKIVELHQRHGVDANALAHRFGRCNRTINDILKGRTHAKPTGLGRTRRRARPRKSRIHVQQEAVA